MQLPAGEFPCTYKWSVTPFSRRSCTRKLVDRISVLVGSMTSTFHTGGALGTLAFASSSPPVLFAPRCVKSGSLKLSSDTSERICAPRSCPNASLE